jgi:hypothetical protein
VESLTTEEEYPYDTVKVASAVTAAGKKSGIGFHVGAGLDFPMGDMFALGLTARYGIASVKIPSGETGETKISAGGLQVGGGLRVRF